jgi:hypothetical protein
MEPGMGSWGKEAEDIAIWEVIGDCLQTSFETLAVGEPEVLAAGEARDGLRNVAVQAVGDEDGGHLGTGAADFYYDHQRERLAARVLLQGELLRYAVSRKLPTTLATSGGKT